MKRLIRIMSMMVFGLLITSCGSGSESNMSLHEYGLTEVSLIREMINNEAYQEIYYGSLDDEMTKILEKLRAGDYSKPESIDYLVLPEESELMDMILSAKYKDEILDGLKKYKFSPELKEYLSKQMVSTLLNACLTQNGIEPMVFYSIIHASKMFVNNKITPENVICIYSYKDTYPLAASFGYGENGSIAMTLNVLAVDDYIDGGADMIKDQMNSILNRNAVTIRKAE